MASPPRPERDADLNSPDDSAAVPSGPWLLRNGPYLLLFLGLFGYLGIYFDVYRLLAIALAALGLGLVVFIHELGHFVVAKLCDVHVETFSIGFGPALPGCHFRWGETTYMIGLFPLGGYVKMVGEGAENDDGEDDPRSFKNKPVWQRMAIISAGVTMNLILAFTCFVLVFKVRGDEYSPGIIDRIDAGSPAWQAGVRSGDVIEWIGAKGPFPSFDSLQPEVRNSQANENLRFDFGRPNASDKEMVHTQVQPRKNAEDMRPVIGIAPPFQLKLRAAGDFSQGRTFPCLINSPASRAHPPFQWSDVIIGTSDPDNPSQVLPLPPDPRNPGHADYFEFGRRMTRLAGKETIIQVRRDDSGGVVNIRVPAAFVYALGMRMRMGKITDIRKSSSASQAGVQVEDIIDQVEVTQSSGQKIRFASSPGKEVPGVIQKEFDPLRLPDDLARWAQSDQGTKEVVITLLRTNPPPPSGGAANHQERQPVTLKLKWDGSWRFNREDPINLYSPISIPELGIAYKVEAIIDGVEPGSPAAMARVEKAADLRFRKDDLVSHAGQKITAADGEIVKLEEGDLISLRKGDVIKACQFYVLDEKDEGGFLVPFLPAMARRWLFRDEKRGDGLKTLSWMELKSDQWANVFSTLQSFEMHKINLRLDRDNLEVSVEGRPDETWPFAERGLFLTEDKRLKKADTIGQALAMGVEKTINFVNEIFGSLRSVATGRVSPKMFGGPILIARAAYFFAGKSFYDFLIFLGMIGVNLAVINFLPIPVLDGGHMVFLIYEKLRGKPAPEPVRVAATYVGLAMILCLMVSVIYLDVSRFFFGG